MFIFERKIYYIDWYEKEERLGNAGFLCLTEHETEVAVHIGIRSLKKQKTDSYACIGALSEFSDEARVMEKIKTETHAGIGAHAESSKGLRAIKNKKPLKCQWYGLKAEEKLLLGEFFIKDGQADFEKVYDAGAGLMEMKGFYFQFGKQGWGNCFVKPEPSDQRKVPVKQTAAAPRGTFSDLLQVYPVVRPFQDQGDYVEIEPMTLKMLAPDYRKLSDNSFLLHGYYTKGHIILGFYQDKERKGYYLGVPGSFDARNQRMAELFGFEGYEHSAGAGYYMRRVEF